MTFHKPLDKMKITQPFGVDYLGNGGPGGKSYADMGLKKGHNGWDLSAPTGTTVYAVMDGELVYTPDFNGYGNDIRIRNKELGLEVVYGHLEKSLAPNGPVKAGDPIALSDNTGFSTGPHLHFGVRKARWEGTAGPFIDDYDNGYFGYIDPAQFFAKDIFDLPVDKQYSATKRGMTDLQWYAANAYFFKTTKRLMTTREKNALVYGYWDLRTVLDPAMQGIWTEMTKPEAQKRGIVK